MKHILIFLTVLLFAVSSYSATRAADSLGQESGTFRQNYNEFRFEIVREFNELLHTDVDSLFAFTANLNSLAISAELGTLDTLRSVDRIDLDAAISSNPNYASMYNILKTSVVTLGHVGETTTDYAFTTAANTTEQSLGVDTVPAYGRILDVTIITTEAVAGITTTFTVDIGDGNGTDEFAAATDIKAVNALIGGDASEAILLMPIATETAIIVNATPDAQNWSEMSGGEFSIITTYLDYGAIK